RQRQMCIRDSMWGHLLMAAGGLTSIADTLMVGGSTFLGLGPAGWVSLILILSLIHISQPTRPERIAEALLRI
ncbi:hypothetical protein QN388_25360, partial [Pseudomonas sp. 5B4]|nr:hypothetical protein [Pseudomonas sp. 5B4]